MPPLTQHPRDADGDESPERNREKDGNGHRF